MLSFYVKIQKHQNNMMQTLDIHETKYASAQSKAKQKGMSY